MDSYFSGEGVACLSGNAYLRGRADHRLADCLFLDTFCGTRRRISDL